MEPLNIHQAKTLLSQLLHVIEQGEEVAIFAIPLIGCWYARAGRNPCCR